MKLIIAKTKFGTLEPINEEGREWLAKQAVGQGLKCEVKKVRNLRFHRKAFSLFRLAFDLWEPADIQFKGQPVQKEFERFRKDLTILAGFYTPVYHLNGMLELEAKSLSFENMGEEEFERVYRAILTVVWDRILKDHHFESPNAVERAVEELLRYE